MSSTFAYGAPFWTDPQLPLLYEFGFAIAPTLVFLDSVVRKDATYIGYSVIQSASASSVGASSLPAGLAAANFSVVLCAQVFDGLSANASMHSAVKVNPLAATTGQGQAVLAAFLQAGLTTGRSATTQQTISIAR